MTDFDRALGDRLDRLGERQGEICFWLRDDDAREPSIALDRLIDLSRDAGVPLALAVIPLGATPALARRIAGAPHVCVLQHGLRHANHATPDEKKSELGDHRPLADTRAELAEGRRLLADFPRSLPILVPPWNRIGAGVASGLGELGFEGLSLHGRRRRSPPAPGVKPMNTHVDLIDWRNGRRFPGKARILDDLALHLDRLLGDPDDSSEATGILTHHLMHDEETFVFLFSLLEYLATRRDCRFLSAASLLA